LQAFCYLILLFVTLFVIYLLLLKVKGPDIYIPPLAGQPEQQRFTMQSGVPLFVV